MLQIVKNAQKVELWAHKVGTEGHSERILRAKKWGNSRTDLSIAQRGIHNGFQETFYVTCILHNLAVIFAQQSEALIRYFCLLVAQFDCHGADQPKIR